MQWLGIEKANLGQVVRLCLRQTGSVLTKGISKVLSQNPSRVLKIYRRLQRVYLNRWTICSDIAYIYISFEIRNDSCKIILSKITLSPEENIFCKSFTWTEDAGFQYSILHSVSHNALSSSLRYKVFSKETYIPSLPGLSQILLFATTRSSFTMVC